MVRLFGCLLLVAGVYISLNTLRLLLLWTWYNACIFSYTSVYTVPSSCILLLVGWCNDSLTVDDIEWWAATLTAHLTPFTQLCNFAICTWWWPHVCSRCNLSKICTWCCLIFAQEFLTSACSRSTGWSGELQRFIYYLNGVQITEHSNAM